MYMVSQPRAVIQQMSQRDAVVVGQAREPRARRQVTRQGCIQIKATFLRQRNHGCANESLADACGQHARAHRHWCLVFHVGQSGRSHTRGAVGQYVGSGRARKAEIKTKSVQRGLKVFGQVRPGSAGLSEKTGHGKKKRSTEP